MGYFFVLGPTLSSEICPVTPARTVYNSVSQFYGHVNNPFWTCALPYLLYFVLFKTSFFNESTCTHMYLSYMSRFVIICSCTAFPFAPYLFKYLGHKTPTWGKNNFRAIFLALQLVDIFSLSLFRRKHLHPWDRFFLWTCIMFRIEFLNWMGLVLNRIWLLIIFF